MSERLQIEIVTLEQYANFVQWLNKMREDKLINKDNVDYTNDVQSAIEVYEFHQYKPAKYVCYVKLEQWLRDSLCNGGRFYHEGYKHLSNPVYPGKVSTWTGQKLGDIIKCGAMYKDNFGGWRVPITVKAINGETYAGTYFKSAGDYCRLKKCKNKIVN